MWLWFAYIPLPLSYKPRLDLVCHLGIILDLKCILNMTVFGGMVWAFINSYITKAGLFGRL